MKKQNRPSGKIAVFHAAGAPAHYLGLEAFAEKHNQVVVYREANFIRGIVAGIVRRDSRRLRKAALNALFCVRLALGLVRVNALVVGFAPYDWTLIFFWFGMRKNKVFLHTSWPNWHARRMPKGDSSIAKYIWRSHFLNCLSGIFFVTSSARNTFLEATGSKIVTSVVCHSYDPRHFFPTPEKNKSDKLRVGFAGRLVEGKGTKDVIAIARQLRSLDVDFVIAGQGPDLPYMEQAVIDQGLKLEFAGWLTPENLGKLFREVDILILPSKRTKRWEEAFGIVIVEAMACGTVPLVTDHAGPKEILGHSSDDWIYDEQEFVDRAVSRIKQYVGNLPELRKDQKICVKRSAQYSKQNIASRWLPISK